MTEQEIEQLIATGKKSWFSASYSVNMPESLIEKNIHNMRWMDIVGNQILSESFIEKYGDELDWYSISTSQPLSEPFIEKHMKKLWMLAICGNQNLSEEFITKNLDSIYWYELILDQELSEDFLDKHSNKNIYNYHWYAVFRYHKFSMDFIEKYYTNISLRHLYRYQKLSEEFREKHNLEIPIHNWLYATKEEKLEYIKKNTSYEIIDDEYLLAYKSTRFNGYSTYNFRYQYKVGETYESNCDYNLYETDSFGLSAWDEDGAKDHWPNGELYKVRIDIDDIGAIVYEWNKIRCTKLTVLERIK